MPDVPAGISGGVPSTYRATIDVLVPAYSSRPRQNVRVGPDLMTTEVPRPRDSLARRPVELALDLRRLNGDALPVSLHFSDEVSALTLKALATSVRMKPTDIIDVRRCLEICFAVDVDADALSHGVRAQGAQLFGNSSNAGTA